MKKHLLALASCALLLLAAGCNNENKEPTSLNANEARPTWAAPEEYDYTSSMTAVISVNLAAKYPTAAADFAVNADDLLAAFVGNDCLGVVSPQDGLFYLYIAGPQTDSQDQTASVTLRYWSAQYKNLFTAEAAFPFVNDDQKGTVAAPFVPDFMVAK